MPNVETFERQTMDPAVRSLARIERLTDVIYGLSFLLILLQIDRPDPAVLLSSESINRYLNDQLPSLGIYLTTFVLVGFYWQSHLFMASRFVRSDATHRWLQLGGLMGVALLPFVNDLLELMPLQSSIQVAYSLVLVQIGFFDLLTLVHGWRRLELLAEPLQVQHRWHEAERRRVGSDGERLNDWTRGFRRPHFATQRLHLPRLLVVANQGQNPPPGGLVHVSLLWTAFPR